MANACFKHAHKVLQMVPELLQKELHLAAFIVRRGKPDFRRNNCNSAVIWKCQIWYWTLHCDRWCCGWCGCPGDRDTVSVQWKLYHGRPESGGQSQRSHGQEGTTQVRPDIVQSFKLMLMSTCDLVKVQIICKHRIKIELCRVPLSSIMHIWYICRPTMDITLINFIN